jgi:hypothetical protein
MYRSAEEAAEQGLYLATNYSYWKGNFVVDFESYYDRNNNVKLNDREAKHLFVHVKEIFERLQR